MKYYLLISLLAIAVLQGCKAPGATFTNKQPGFLYSESVTKLINDKTLFTATTEVVPVDTIFAVGDTLHVVTKKISGCNADDFKLMWNGVLTSASKPAQTNLKILQQIDPACKEKHQFHLTYNIKPLRQKPDSVINKTTLLGFGNYGHKVEYKY